jgi:hypothetical protein
MKGLLLALVLLWSSAAASAQTCTVKLQWDSNSEPDLAGYTLVWGSASGVYTQSVGLPPTATTHSVVLPNGVYFFAIRAFNTAGLQSGYSNEVMTKLDCSVPSERRPPLQITGVVVFIIT